MDNETRHEPVFNVPGAVLAITALLVAIHAGRQFLSAAHEDWLVLALAFIPARYAGFAADIPGGVPAMATSFATHMLVHGDKFHLLINCAWLLAFGSVIARRIGSLRFLSLFVASGIAGAVTFLVLHPGLAQPVVGASGGISGLMGATLRFLFPAMDSGQGWMLREAPASIRRMSLNEAFANRRFLAATASFVILNLLAIWGLGTPGASGPIAWEAHLGGYFFGVFAFALFDIAAQTDGDVNPKVE